VYIKNVIIPKLQNWAKSHPKMKFIVIALITVYLAIYHFFLELMKNKWKYTVVVAALLVFLISSSFSAIMQADDKRLGTNQETEEILTADSQTAQFSIEGQEQVYQLEEYQSVSEDSIDDAIEETNTLPGETVIINENGKESTPEFEDDWKLILVNKQNMVPRDYKFELGTVRGSIQADVRILGELNEMFAAAQKDGIMLSVCSGSRDYGRQTVLFDKKIKKYMARGMSYFDAYSIASQAVTIPGKSEHQIGLALDIISNEYHDLNEGFAETDAGKWLKEHSAEYGFILRYPKGKENITGIEFEPWHFRYVGVDAAKEITQQGITLEEYVEQIGMK